MRKIFIICSLLTTSALFAEESVKKDSIAPVEIESVTILAPRKDVGHIVHLSGSEILLTSDDLRKFHQADGNQMLQSLPGVYTQQEDGWGLRLNVGLRGTGVLRSSRVTLMEDGVLASPAPYSSPSAYYTPPFWKFQSIEILKGSAQLLAGPQTTGGGINMLTPVLDEKNDLLVNYSYGNYGQNRFGVLGELKVAKRTSIGFGLNRSGALGFKNTGGQVGGGYRLTDGYLKLGHHLDNKDIHHLELMIGGTDELSNQTYLGTTFNDAQNNPEVMYFGAKNDTMDLSRWLTRFSYTYNIKPGWFRIDVYQQNVSRNWYKLDKINAGNGSVGIASILMDPLKYSSELIAVKGEGISDAIFNIKANNRVYTSRGIQFRGQYTHDLKSLKVTHEAGLRLHFDSEDRFQWSDEYIKSNNELELKSKGIPGVAGNRIDEASARSVYYRNTWRSGAWTLQGGIRLEHIIAQRIDFATTDINREGDIKLRQNETLEWLPGFSVNRTLSQSWIVFGGLHKGFSPAGSKPGVLPEESLNAEAGIKHHSIPLQFTVFRSSYSRLLGSDAAASGGTGEGSLYNGGAAIAEGFEIRLGQKIKNFTVELSGTYTSAYFTQSFKSEFEEWGDIEVGDVLPYIPLIQGMLKIDYQLKGWQLSSQTVYGGERKSVSSQDHWDLPASWVQNIAIGRWFKKKYQCALAVQNLFNTQHIIAARPAGYRTYTPRMLMLKFGYQIL